MTITSDEYRHQAELLKETREEIASSSTSREANVWYCNAVNSLRDARSLERAKSRRSLEHSRYGVKQGGIYA